MALVGLDERRLTASIDSRTEDVNFFFVVGRIVEMDQQRLRQRQTEHKDSVSAEVVAVVLDVDIVKERQMLVHNILDKVMEHSPSHSQVSDVVFFVVDHIQILSHIQAQGQVHTLLAQLVPP
jgi:hypothetical protein